MTSADHRVKFEKKTLIVVVITTFTMFLEISVGSYTHSMALLADGYHMASHVFAMGLTWIAYIFTRKHSATNSSYTFNKDRLLSLTGFTSAIVLAAFAFLVAYNSIQHILHPVPIMFLEAIVVAFLGLLVNLVSAWFLHADHEHHDHNIRAAYIHVLADALTSIAAILALGGGWLFGILWLDAIGGLICSAVIVKWVYNLIMTTGKALVDYKRT